MPSSEGSPQLALATGGKRDRGHQPARVHTGSIDDGVEQNQGAGETLGNDENNMRHPRQYGVNDTPRGQATGPRVSGDGCAWR